MNLLYKVIFRKLSLCTLDQIESFISSNDRDRVIEYLLDNGISRCYHSMEEDYNYIVANGQYSISYRTFVMLALKRLADTFVFRNVIINYLVEQDVLDREILANFVYREINSLDQCLYHIFRTCSFRGIFVTIDDLF